MPNNADKIPLYLAWYFLRIRKHSGENDYFVSRFADMEKDRMLIEVQMVEQLHKLNLVMLPDKRADKVFNPLAHSPAPGVTVHSAGTQEIVHYWERFDITPAGKYFVREAIISGIGTIGWTVFVAAVSAIVALFVAK